MALVDHDGFLRWLDDLLYVLRRDRPIATTTTTGSGVCGDCHAFRRFVVNDLRGARHADVDQKLAILFARQVVLKLSVGLLTSYPSQQTTQSEALGLNGRR